MDIYTLLNATYKIDKTRRPAYVFSSKPFGQVFTSNKTVVYKPNINIVEMNMVMGVATEQNRSAHRISIAVHGVKGEEYTTLELMKLIRESSSKYKDADNIDILSKIFNGDKVLKDKAIMQKDTNSNKFYVFDNKISLRSEVRVKCTCSDFYYTFAWYNADHRTLIGRRPPKYKKYVGLSSKEKETTAPLRNPKRLPGVCKHLLLFFALLMKDGIINESEPVMASFKKSTGGSTLVPKLNNKLNLVPRSNINTMLENLKDEMKEVNNDRRLQRQESKDVETKSRTKRIKSRNRKSK